MGRKGMRSQWWRPSGHKSSVCQISFHEWFFTCLGGPRGPHHHSISLHQVSCWLSGHTGDLHVALPSGAACLMGRQTNDPPNGEKVECQVPPQERPREGGQAPWRRRYLSGERDRPGRETGREEKRGQKETLGRGIARPRLNCGPNSVYRGPVASGAGEDSVGCGWVVWRCDQGWTQCRGLACYSDICLKRVRKDLQMPQGSFWKPP
jgi:hypothetical protein